MIIGIDVDGVLADFNEEFVKRVVAVTGEDRWGNDPENRDDFPPTWDYPEAYGYSENQLKKVWRDIKSDDLFWATLPPYSDTVDAVKALDGLRVAGHDIYFVTSRPGVRAKWQTETWLMAHGMAVPTVIISGDKGQATRFLNLDIYIDDRLLNVNDVMRVVREDGRRTRVYLASRPWNDRPAWKDEYPPITEWDQQVDPAVVRVSGVEEMLGMEGF